MTGTFDLDADLSASGPADELARAARGTFRFTARDGQILKAPAIARILSLDAVAAVLRARPSELMASGLDYSELAVAGTLDAGRVRIESGTLNAAALGLAMAGEIDVPAGQVDMQRHRRAVQPHPGRDAARPDRGPHLRRPRRRDSAERHRRPARPAGRAARTRGDRPEPGEPDWCGGQDADRSRSIRSSGGPSARRDARPDGGAIRLVPRPSREEDAVGKAMQRCAVPTEPPDSRDALA